MHALALTALFLLTAALQVADNELIALLAKRMSGTIWPHHEVDQVLRLLVSYPVGAALGALAFAKVFPRVRPVTGCLWGLGMLLVSQGLMGFLPPLEVALALRALAGAGSGILAFNLLAAAAERGTTQITAMTVGFLLGLVVGPLLATELVTRAGFTPYFLGLAGINGTLWVGFLVLRRRDPGKMQINLEPMRFRSILKNRTLFRGILCSVAIAAAIGAPMALFPTALQTDAGISLLTLGRVYLVAGLAPLLAWPFSQSLVRSRGAFFVARAGAIALVPFLTFMSVATSGVVLATGTLFGALLIETARRTALQAHVAALAEESSRSRFLALRNLMVYLGLAAGRGAATEIGPRWGLLWVTVMAAFLACASAVLTPGEDSEPVRPSAGNSREPSEGPENS